MNRFQQARADARRLFPQWTRRMRAKWVLARLLTTPEPKVAISAGWPYNANAFAFARRLAP